MAKRIMSKAGVGSGGGAGGHRRPPTNLVYPSVSESNLPRMSSHGGGGVSLAPSGSVTMLKNRVLYRSRSDFDDGGGEREARV